MITDRLKPVQAAMNRRCLYGAWRGAGDRSAKALSGAGPGFLNGCAALCTAQALNVPLFALIGQIPSRIGKGFGLLLKSAVSGNQHVTKSATSVTQGTDAPAPQCLTTMLSGCPGGRGRGAG